MSAVHGEPDGDPEVSPSRLPSLGRRGGGWVGLQVAFLVAAVATGVLGAAWPSTAIPWLYAPGAIAV